MSAPNNPIVQAEFQRGFEHHRAGRLAEAAASYGKVVQADPSHADALHLLGSIKAQSGDPAEGVRLIGAALALRPDVALMWSNHANALSMLGRGDEAVAGYKRAIELAPDNVAAHYSLCGQLIGDGRAAEALEAMDRALASLADHHVLLTGKGRALAALRRFDEAMASYDAAVRASPRNVDALCGHGLVLNEMGRYAEAIGKFDQAIGQVPGHLDSIIGRCHAQTWSGKASEALVTLDKVVGVIPGHPVAHYARAHALLRLLRTADAALAFAKSAELDPKLTEARYNHADCLRAMGRYDEAIPVFQRVLADDPDHVHAMSGMAVASMQCCDWEAQRSLTPRIEEKVKQGSRGIMPFAFLSMSSSKELQLLCSQAFIRNTCDLSAKPFPRRTDRGDGRIRIGYLSSDFRRHAMAYQMVELFEVHDRSRFEIIGFSGGEDDGSEVRKRIARGLDAFHDVIGRTSEEIARLVHEQRIDVAVDLNGNTINTLIGALAWRPAPAQATYLGFPGTSGAPFIDYVIADATVAPLEDERFICEKIVHLPGCYQVSDSQRRASTAAPTRTQYGLPQDAFVFCCFNTSYKISEEIFDVWMRILKAVPRSVLWLVRANDVMAANLRRAASERGVTPERLVFCSTVEPSDHLARHALADLYFDTLPYNSHGTGSFALWGGLPMLACRGPTFCGRVAASLLQAIDLPELVTESLEEYEALAIALGSHPERLAALRAKLERNRTTAPLFDTRLFSRHIEASYTTMHEIAQRGEKPRSFAVERLG